MINLFQSAYCTIYISKLFRIKHIQLRPIYIITIICVHSLITKSMFGDLVVSVDSVEIKVTIRPRCSITGYFPAIVATDNMVENMFKSQ